jgi:type II secretory pathway pseudopilin PulG
VSRFRIAAFTLIEVLAAVFLTSLVMSVAISFFVNLSDSTDAAAQKIRQARQALAVLDRVARDLEGAYLLSNSPGLHAQSQSWSFVAESEVGDSASDRVRFVSRSYRPRNRLDHGSDLAVISYVLDSADDAAGFDLLRSVSPGLPSDALEEFQADSDESFMVVAERIQHFGLYFMGADREWHETWDSTQAEQSAALPRAARIEIAYLPTLASGADDFDRIDLEEGEMQIYTRQVRLPMQAIDLAAILANASAEDDEREEEEDDEDELDDGEDFEDDELGLPGSSQDQPNLPDDLDDLDLLKDIKRLGLPDDFDPSLLRREGRRLRRLDNLR